MSTPFPVDPKRTVKATLFEGFDEDAFYPDFVAAGAAARYPAMPDHLFFGCPGCGKAGCIKAANPKPPNDNGASWDVTAGTLDDPTTLTLNPSILCKGCCGWHGHLVNGEFKSC